MAMADLSRRGFLSGFGSLIVAPAIVPFASLMPVRGIVQEVALPIMRGPVWDELAAITRKAFVPRLFVQLYRTNSLLLAMNGEGGG